MRLFGLSSTLLLLPSLCITCGFMISHPSPVVIIPGLGGSVLKTKEETPTHVWPPSLFPKTPIDVVCDPDCRSLHPIEPYPLGDLRGIRVDTFLTYLFTRRSFYEPLVSSLQQHSVPVSALSYDFRLIYPNALEDLYQKFRNFFEKQEQPVTIIAHSLGGLLFHDFLLSTTTQEWQERHLQQIVYVNVPFGGVPIALFHTLHSVLGSVEENSSMLRYHRISSLHHFAGLLWCLPLLDTNVLRWNQRWYCGGQENINELCKEWNLPVLQSFWAQYQGILKKRLLPPSVPTLILYGTGSNTTCFKDWETGLVLTTDGDGTVPTDSHLFYKDQWKQKQSSFVQYIEIPGMEHNNLLPEHILPFLSLPHPDF